MPPEAESIKITDLISVCIAALALFVTFWQGAISRRHNKLSVQPMLVHHTDTIILPEGIRASFKIKNVGIGPAKIFDRYFLKNSTRYSPKNESDPMREICRELIGSSTPYIIESTEMFGGKAIIPPGAEITLIKVLFVGLAIEDVQKIQKMTDDMDFKIEYQSIYGDYFVYASNQ